MRLPEETRKIGSKGTVSPVLEIIACSVEDAVEAERGGAGRLEVVRELERGGLTPPLQLVREILGTVSLPVRVMLRESEGYTVEGNREVEKLCTVARELAVLPVEGLVLGFLDGGEVDVELLERVLSCAPDLKATFHHAFEETCEPLAAIRALKTVGGVDRILTRGGAGDWARRVEHLRNFERQASPEIKILVGGGVDAQVLNEVIRLTCIREFHVGRAARIPPRADGVVREEKVRELVRVIEAWLAEQ